MTKQCKLVLRKKFFLIIPLVFLLFPLPEKPASLQYLSLAEKSGVKRAFIQGDEGEYTASVAIKANIDSIWTVLTDYDNFEQYMPNVIESSLIENHGKQKIFTQEQVFPVLFFAKKAKVKILVTEDYPRQIEFRVIEGDVKYLKGVWKVRRMSDEEFLVTHEVSVDPGLESNNLRTLFFNIYKDTLLKTLEVIEQEATRRFHEF